MKPLVIEATAAHTASLIFLHGLGDSGHGWAPVFKHVARSRPHMRFILPHAPSQPVTLNQGVVMPAWYDIYHLAGGPLGGSHREDEQGLDRSRALLIKLIKEEQQKTGLALNRIFIGGFSQGAALSLYLLLQGKHQATSAEDDRIFDVTQLGGIVALSGYVPCLSSIRLTPMSAGPSDHASLPVFIGHGQVDPLIPMKWHTASVEAVRELMPNLKLVVKTYPHVAHSTCPEEIDDLTLLLPMD